MQPQDITDVIERARAGDREAWNTIVGEYASLVWWVIRGFRLTQGQAADAAQTAWLRLIEHLDSIREPERLAGWLRTTTRRVCLEILRESSRETPVDYGEAHAAATLGRTREQEEDGPEAATVREEHQRLVRTALSTLPPRDRALLELLASSDTVSYRQIGGQLGMPVGSIGPTRARVLARLRAALEREGIRDAALR